VHLVHVMTLLALGVCYDSACTWYMLW